MKRDEFLGMLSWEEYILELIKKFQRRTSCINCFPVTYWFSNRVFMKMSSKANFHHRDSFPLVPKGFWRFTQIPGEPTIEIFYIFDDPLKTRMYPYRITAISDGYGKYYFDSSGKNSHFFPAELVK